MTRQDVLRTECEAAGFTFETYAPGDGLTRYRFWTLDPDHTTRGYFHAFGDYTALGWKEALTYATGRVHGANQS